MDNIPHVVMAVDVGVPQHTVEVLVDGFNDDMWVAGKDGDEWAFGEENPHLRPEPKVSVGALRNRGLSCDT